MFRPISTPTAPAFSASYVNFKASFSGIFLPPKSNKTTPLTKDSILNDILNETANSGEWQNIEKEAEVKSVVDNTQNLPDHLANAFTKDYSQVLKKAEEKAKFNRGT